MGYSRPGPPGTEQGTPVQTEMPFRDAKVPHRAAPSLFCRMSLISAVAENNSPFAKEACFGVK